MSRAPPSTVTQSATLVVLLLCTLSRLCSAGELEVVVTDRAGAPLPNVVVTAADGRTTPVRSAEFSMVMDQLNMRFTPEVLVVPVGGAVSFPNSDSVSHQVYSFSAAKRFQLPLYKGSAHPPVVFDKPGLVVVGCNIHDQMVGYVYVTDARWYGQTAKDGKVAFADVPAGKVKVTVWNPRIADAAATLTREAEVPASSRGAVEFRLAKTLRAQPEPRPRNPDWDY